MSKGVQKNMLKVWNFTKIKICCRCFDNKSQKVFRTKIRENKKQQILLKLLQWSAYDLDFKWK